MKLLLAAHRVQDMDRLTVIPVENAHGRRHQLTISRSLQFRWKGTHLRVSGEISDVFEDVVDKTPGGIGMFQRDIVGDGVEILERGYRPDYFSHRDMAERASSCETVRPSSMARSPRAIPSRTVIRRCNCS